MRVSKRDTEIKNRLLDSVGEGKGGMIWENSTETCILPYVKQIASPGSMHETGCSGPVHWDDPEGWGGRRGFRMGDTCTPVADSCQIRSDQSLSCVRLFATPWIAARQASLSITNSQSSLRLTSIELVMPSSHLILCHPLHLLPPIPPSIRVFSNESTLCTRWQKPQYCKVISLQLKWINLKNWFVKLCLFKMYNSEWNNTICSNMDRHRDDHTKWRQPKAK